ncbi:MAG TPA: hypothetical protein DIW51_08985 [Rhodospirillaceae bacterium]|nr:hypothetical protein [Magnetovibrio sp.]HBT44307.1 hypothetical protein [Rhodospirillaceae bacterium]HCS70088.1 hypothetical protein [Rhodospirillaceae bacterium]
MIDQIEDAMIARMKAAATPEILGYTYGSCETYDGEIDEDRLIELANRAPAAWLVFAGDKEHRRAGGTRYVTGTFVVLLAARSLRNQADARRGSGDRVGAYQMTRDVIALIDGRKLGLDLVEPLKFTERRTLFSKRTRQTFAAVYAVTFTCIYALPAHPDALDDFAAVAGDWELPGAPPSQDFEADYQADPDDSPLDA